MSAGPDADLHAARKQDFEPQAHVGRCKREAMPAETGSHRTASSTTHKPGKTCREDFSLTLIRAVQLGQQFGAEAHSTIVRPARVAHGRSWRGGGVIHPPPMDGPMHRLGPAVLSASAFACG